MESLGQSELGHRRGHRAGGIGADRAVLVQKGHKHTGVGRALGEASLVAF